MRGTFIYVLPLMATKTAILNPDGTVSSNMLWTVYYYDEYGRVVKTYKQHYLGGSSNYSINNYDETTTSYDFTNAVTKTLRQHHTAAASGAVTLAMTDSLIYDHMGRLTQDWNRVNSGSMVLLSQTDYNEVGQAMTKHLHSTDGGTNFLQNVQYTYNERGWLKSSSAPLFAEQLKYNDGTTPQYNGNISQMLYSGTNSGSKTFSYTYDKVNRLTAAASTSNALDESLSYDVIGNIKSLTRGGVSAATLAYSYNLGGQLQSVTNSGSAFRSYGYDDNGNATSDGGSKSISYNLLNLPRNITQSSSSIATYTYDAAGQKVRNTGSDGTWDYDNGLVYLNPVSNTGSTIQFIQTPEGRIVNNSGTYKYKYDLKDHLGNVRVTFDAGTSGAAETVQEDEYYSFGLRKSLYDNADGNRYLYNGKEEQTDLTNQYEYGWRFYDPVIGKMTTMDRFAEKYPQICSYSYAANNPVNLIDIQGDSLWVSYAEKQILYSDGGFYNEDGTTYKGKGVKTDKNGNIVGYSGFLGQTFDALSAIGGTKEGSSLLSELQSSDNNYMIQKSSTNGFVVDRNQTEAGYANQLKTDPEHADELSRTSPAALLGGAGGKINWDPNGASVWALGGQSNNAASNLGHELFHGQDANRGLLDSRTFQGLKYDEWQATYKENQLRGQMGLPLREYYRSQSANGVLSPLAPRVLDNNNQPIKPSWTPNN